VCTSKCVHVCMSASMFMCVLCVYMCLCVYVYVCVPACTCVCVCRYVCVGCRHSYPATCHNTHTNTHTYSSPLLSCLFVCVCLCVFVCASPVCVCARKFANTLVPPTHIHTCIHTLTHTPPFLRSSPCLLSHPLTHTHKHIYTHTYTHIHTHTYTHIHTHTHTHIHTLITFPHFHSMSFLSV